jgi:hypothetical protein
LVALETTTRIDSHVHLIANEPFFLVFRAHHSTGHRILQNAIPETGAANGRGTLAGFELMVRDHDERRDAGRHAEEGQIALPVVVNHHVHFHGIFPFRIGRGEIHLQPIDRHASDNVCIGGD